MLSYYSDHALTQVGFSGMNYANFSSLKRHIGQPLIAYLALTAFEVPQWGKRKVFPLLILSGSEVSSPSACPSAVHCPPVEVSLPCLPVRSGGGLCPFLLTRWLFSLLWVFCKLVTPRCISRFSSFEVYICVCVVCLCSDVCAYVHTGPRTHVWTWKPEISIEYLLLLLSTSIFIYLCFWDRVSHWT